MRKLIVAGLLLGGLGFSTVASVACGDKLVTGAGFGRFLQSNRPASILAFTPESSPLSEIVRDLQSQIASKRAPHQLRVVAGPSELGEALRTGKYDLLLVNASDAEIVEQQARSADSKPMLLPVVYKSTKEETKLVEKRFRSVLKAPGSVGTYLAAIDDAMFLKLKSR